MVLREIKNMYIKNRLTEGVDFKRYEWLKGDGSARISIIFNGWRETLNYIIQALDGNVGDLVYLSTSSIPNDTYYYEYGYFIGGAREFTLRHGIRTRRVATGPSDIFLIDQKNDGQYEDRIYNISLKKTDVNKVTFTINGSDYLKTGRFDSRLDFDAPMPIFANAAKISAFNTDRYNLVPCQLLKSIPATLDANNRARQAGECGMYDSISGKFYGNVSNTGTFTVEGDVEPETHSGLQQIYQNRLIEGVDYQTYDWLKGDGKAYIDTKVTDLSVSDYIKTIFDDSGNIGVRKRTWGREGNRLVVGNDNSSSVIFVWGASSTIYHENGGIYVYDMYFDLLNNKVIINNQTYSLSLFHGNGSSFLLFARHNPNIGADFINWAKYKSFEIHNQINLVPCTLLRSIPRNLDAQCKERVAGECGMIDLISGKFYGNVANSGTFSVSDDS